MREGAHRAGLPRLSGGAGEHVVREFVAKGLDCLFTSGLSVRRFWLSGELLKLDLSQGALVHFNFEDDVPGNVWIGENKSISIEIRALFFTLEKLSRTLAGVSGLETGPGDADSGPGGGHLRDVRA